MQKNKTTAEFITGKNAILECLKAGRSINYIMIVKTQKNKKILELISQKSKEKIPIRVTNTRKFYNLFGAKHQNIAANVSVKKYVLVEDILAKAKLKNEPEFIVICDCIEDPYNLGSIIRSAECAGVHGIIIPSRHSASLNFTVEKASAGALEHILVARVTNLVSTVKFLKKQGIFVYGTDVCGENFYNKKTCLTNSTALVVGNEGKGISQLLKKNCDEIFCIPMYGKIQSLNVSVATGILLYEFKRARVKSEIIN
ncbi:MAG: 23S rRNA (guanosine(2251)-2'-O)-methyltransferase RlmB [Oscillospiraceae bacterium]|jgi:23S rRNA (guanosine2251-2'-O)-methyltransferase|nr:23S rRNA (guanosine(2251)-2'-O)-methyltransferase RlmB [Oscillospiraceae bacterium]